MLCATQVAAPVPGLLGHGVRGRRQKPQARRRSRSTTGRRPGNHRVGRLNSWPHHEEKQGERPEEGRREEPRPRRPIPGARIAGGEQRDRQPHRPANHRHLGHGRRTRYLYQLHGHGPKISVRHCLLAGSRRPELAAKIRFGVGQTFSGRSAAVRPTRTAPAGCHERSPAGSARTGSGFPDRSRSGPGAKRRGLRAPQAASGSGSARPEATGQRADMLGRGGTRLGHAPDDIDVDLREWRRSAPQMPMSLRSHQGHSSTPPVERSTVRQVGQQGVAASFRPSTSGVCIDAD